MVYSYLAHRGEEPALSGSSGSGTVFFSHCSMHCRYCQNYFFSQLGRGEEVTPEGLAAIMLSLQRSGCHNINLVSPTHYLPPILHALEEALMQGLEVPIVYNTSGYERPEIVRLLDGVIDVYLPDMRYADDAMAQRYSDAPGYVDHNRAAVREMHRQVGNLTTDARGIAERGMIIRLLVLPNAISGTTETLSFIAAKISPQATLSIMSQYYPTFEAPEVRELSRRITAVEYANVVDEAQKLGLNRGWVQEVPAEDDDAFLGTKIKPMTDSDDHGKR